MQREKEMFSSQNTVNGESTKKKLKVLFRIVLLLIYSFQTALPTFLH